MKYIFFILISWTVHQHTYAQQETTKIYLVRHAEKDNTIKQDPPLTAQGIERSERLASILQDVPVDQLFSSKALRAKQTLMPLSKANDLRIDIYDTKDTASMEKLFSLI